LKASPTIAAFGPVERLLDETKLAVLCFIIIIIIIINHLLPLGWVPNTRVTGRGGDDMLDNRAHRSTYIQDRLLPASHSHH
jgi:hypothetical protein